MSFSGVEQVAKLRTKHNDTSQLMSGYSDRYRVTLDVNGQQAEDTLKKLRGQAQDWQTALARAAAEGDKVAMKKAEQELRRVNREIRAMESNAQEAARVLAALDKATPRELRRTLAQLKRELEGIERGSKAWDAQVERIRRVQNELDSVNRSMRQHETGWQSFTRRIGDFKEAIMGGIAAMAGVSAAANEAVKAYAEMEQEMANVRKFTGMTAEEVEALNEEFKNMDTRTSREELNKLAQEAGMLGKTTQEDVLGYVRAADVINVALDDLGKDATLTLSKLTGIFGVEDEMGTERSLLAVGSVINELSQNCEASSSYLAEFASRMGGVGAQAGMTIQQIMAFAAVLDSNNQNVEASSTALAQVLTRMYQEPAKYASVAKLDVQQFTNLLKTDANEALLTFLDALKGSGGMAELAPMFKDMGETGARAVSALSVLAGSIDEVRQQQQVANQAFADGTSVQKEFDVQNNTVQANLDKSKKRFHELVVEIGEQLLPVVNAAMTAANAMMKVISTIINFVIEYRKEIIVAAAAIAGYTVTVKAHSIAMAALELRTKAAAVATRLFNAALKANPIGLAVAAVTALAAALIAFRNRTNDAAAAQKALNEIREDAQKNVAEEKTRIELLVAAAENERLSLEERRKAIDKLNDIIPDYNAQLDETTGKYTANKEALDKYLESLAKKYELEGAEKQLAAIGEETASLNARRVVAQRNLEDERKRQQESYSSTPRPQTSGGAVVAASVGETVGNAAVIQTLEDEIAEIDSLLTQQEQLRTAITGYYGADLQRKAIEDASTDGNTNNNGNGGNGNGNDTTSTTDRFAAEKAWRERSEALEKIAYFQGQKNYEEYTRAMDDIAVEYYKRQLEHTELSADERLAIEAQYWEAKAKMEKNATAADYSAAKDEEDNRYNEQLAELKQFYIDGKLTREQYQELEREAELEHKKRLVEITKEGTEERLDAERQYGEALMAEQMRRRREMETSIADMRKRYFSISPEEEKKALDRTLDLLKQAYEQELAMAGDNEERKQQVTKEYNAARAEIEKETAEESGGNLFDTLNNAFGKFGEWLESEGGQALQGGLQTVVSQMSAIFSALTQSIQAEAALQAAAIEKRYDKEIDAAQGNSYKVEKLEKQKEDAVAAVKNEANRKAMNMQVIQAIAQTAQAALNAYSSAAAIPVVGYILAPIAAAAATAAGMLQVAAIKKQQEASEAQGYAEGGFTPRGRKYEPVGTVHAGEWVASQKLVNSPVTRPVIDMLEWAQRNNTIGSLRATDVSRSITAQQTVAATATDGQTNALLGIVAQSVREQGEATRQLRRRLAEPFVTVNTVTGDTGIKKAQDDYNRLMRNKSPKSRYSKYQ